ncbi:MAG TPA: hypothetical protein VH372_22325 [Actinospica sp.]|nr:hypothetical protein [Actinospica sp.]
MRVLRSVWAAAEYEATRLRTHRSTFGVVGLAMFGSALATLPAARAAVNSGYPQAHVAWVVSGGSAGMILPGTVAVLGTAWLGAGLVVEDYRYGIGLTTYTRLPRRGATLFGKLLVALVLGLWLAASTRLAAYLTALGGFALARGSSAAEHVSIALPLALPTPAEYVFAGLGGVLGVLCAPVLRLRVLAVPAAWLATAFVAALMPGSRSPYTQDVVYGMMRLGLPVEQTALALPEALVLGLLLVALVSVCRRRID